MIQSTIILLKHAELHAGLHTEGGALESPPKIFKINENNNKHSIALFTCTCHGSVLVKFLGFFYIEGQNMNPSELKSHYYCIPSGSSHNGSPLRD